MNRQWHELTVDKRAFAGHNMLAQSFQESEKLALDFEIPHGDFYDVQFVLHLAGRKKP